MMRNRYRLLSACMGVLSTPAAISAQSQSTATNQTPPATVPTSGTPDAGTIVDGAGVEDIVVTAQRRSERLQNVPIAVSAASAARLEAAGVANTQELAILTPGLSAPQTAGFAQPHIRGVGSSTAGAGLEQPVATYVDGVYIAAAPASLLTLNNVDRVEVLKGPQGTLFGRNATGGLIQVITRDPGDRPTAAFNLSYANYADVTADTYLGGGIARDLTADLAVRYEHQDRGWGRNLATGNYTGDLDHDFAARTKLLFTPGPDTRIRLSLDYEDRNSRREAQHLDPQYPGTFNNAVFGGPFPMGNRYDVDTDRDQSNQLKGGGAALQVNQDIGPVAIQSITAYRRSDLTILLDTDQTPLPILNVAATSRAEQFSQELQVSSKSPGRLKWVAGLFYFHADDRWAPFQVIFGPSPISPVPNVPVTLEERDRQRTDSIAGYAQATYELLPATNLTLGGRFTYERKRADGVTNLVVAGFPAATTPVPTPGLGIPSHISFNRFSYRVALDHRFGPDILGYVSYNTGFKSGGYNLAVADNPPYRPETIGAAEVGLKTELFNRRVRLNTSAFRYDYKNIQVGRFIGGTEAIYNGARAHVYGVDLDGELALARGLSLTGGLSYLHARFTSFPNADIIVPIPGFPPNLGAVVPGSAKGRALPFSPNFTFNVGGDYKVEVPIGTLALNATYFRTGRFFAAPDNVGFQRAYDLVNAAVTWTDRSGRLSLKVWGKNLGNTAYVTSLVEANQGLIDSIGAPRTYGVTAGFKF